MHLLPITVEFGSFEVDGDSCENLFFFRDMECHESRLFAPYKVLGGVCTDVPPAFRTLPTKRRITSVLVALGNVVVGYTAERLRLVSLSDVLPSNIQCVAADKRYVYAAVHGKIAILHLSR